MDTMKGLKRTHYCTQLTTADIGKEVVAAGFVQKIRNLGNLIFIDLRDRTGILQLAFDDTVDKELLQKGICQPGYPDRGNRGTGERPAHPFRGQDPSV